MGSFYYHRSFASHWESCEVLPILRGDFLFFFLFFFIIITAELVSSERENSNGRGYVIYSLLLCLLVAVERLDLVGFAVEEGGAKGRWGRACRY